MALSELVVSEEIEVDGESFSPRFSSETVIRRIGELAKKLISSGQIDRPLIVPVDNRSRQFGNILSRQLDDLGVEHQLDTNFGISVTGQINGKASGYCQFSGHLDPSFQERRDLSNTPVILASGFTGDGFEQKTALKYFSSLYGKVILSDDISQATPKHVIPVALVHKPSIFKDSPSLIPPRVVGYHLKPDVYGVGYGIPLGETRLYADRPDIYFIPSYHAERQLSHERNKQHLLAVEAIRNIVHTELEGQSMSPADTVAQFSPVLPGI